MRGNLVAMSAWSKSLGFSLTQQTCCPRMGQPRCCCPVYVALVGSLEVVDLSKIVSVLSHCLMRRGMKLVFVCVWLGLMFFRLKPPIGLPLVVWTRLMLSLPNKQLSISARQIKFISVAILTGRYLFKTAGPSSNLASQMSVLGVVKKMDFCIGLGFVSILSIAGVISHLPRGMLLWTCRSASLSMVGPLSLRSGVSLSVFSFRIQGSHGCHL